MILDEADVIPWVKDEGWPAYRKERTRLDTVDDWLRWKPDAPHQPRQSTTEYRQLAARSQTGWLGLVVDDLVEVLYVEGYRPERANENASAWRWWQVNDLDSHQVALHHAAIAYSLAYTTVLPGELELTGEQVPVIRGISPRRMIAMYVDPGWDRWPTVALHAVPVQIDKQPGYRLKVYDDLLVHRLEMRGDDVATLDYKGADEHAVGLCPVVRYANKIDLEGRTDGEINEGTIAVAARINQTTFDRLVVQRFASWVVRTIAGMAKPDEQADAEAEKLRLKVEDILIAEDHDTRFGHLPASDLKGFLDAGDNDVRVLAAVTQASPQTLSAQMVNLSAEALAALEAGKQRKAAQRKMTLGNSHEQTLRLAAWVMGDKEGWRDTSAQVRWRDMEARSLAQVADALGKMAQMLGVPVQALWERIPGVSDQDVERWKALAEEGGAMDELLRQLTGNTQPALPAVNGN